MEERIFYQDRSWLVSHQRLVARSQFYRMDHIAAVRLRRVSHPGLLFMWWLGILLIPSALATRFYGLLLVAVLLMALGIGAFRQILEVQMHDGRWQSLPHVSPLKARVLLQAIERAILSEPIPEAPTESSAIRSSFRRFPS